MKNEQVKKKKYIWKFLTDLLNNNSKEWMDENRERYHTAKDYWLQEVDLILKRLSKHDSYYSNFTPKQVIHRINNNRMFQPDRPLYKGHFSFSPMSKTDRVMRMYFTFGPGRAVIGGGLYRPEKEGMESVRQAIDYDAKELLDIINEKKFKKLFGGLAKDPNKLKTKPRGYDIDHPHIELLRRKSFTGSFHPTKKQLVENDLADMIEESYLALQPLVKWLDMAVSV